MATQLTLLALDRELRSQEPLPPYDLPDDRSVVSRIGDKPKAPACTLVTGTGLTIAELSAEVRSIVADFFLRNPATVSLVVNSPMNRHYQHPKLRGQWEVLAFREGGLQDSKNLVLNARSTASSSIESLLRSALEDWKV